MKRSTRSKVARLDRRTILGAIAASPLAVSVSACDLLSTDPAEDGNGGGSNDGGLAETEAPALAQLVEAGELPALEERLPDSPLVVEPTDRLGVYGGTWNTVLLGPADTFWLNKTIGHESLLRWDPEWTMVVPNVAESIDASDDGTEFTITLRAGMKWSDGEPFTTADVMFYFEDVQFNEELYPVLPRQWTAEG
jgi:peptide/nickel transport system substrate-binding protein